MNDPQAKIIEAVAKTPVCGYSKPILIRESLVGSACCIFTILFYLIFERPSIDSVKDRSRRQSGDSSFLLLMPNTDTEMRRSLTDAAALSPVPMMAVFRYGFLLKSDHEQCKSEKQTISNIKK